MSSIPASEIAYRLLRLEQQLESYQHLHAQELEEIRHVLQELKAQLLGMDPARTDGNSESDRVIP